ncbi:MAG: saccharopine dehydrogenase NADP-binding domain-containing protein [Bacteroidetes bacterium]|nr:saccharopine dehydrogenase NADP-binding domain-containing protein [Bacteroidota bacterium]MBU1718145.1 saccharopine dehydrogenase NADP-binding domain-containing protein [Bacteroidota bacterium]
MKKVLILGAGMVVKPIVQHLLQKYSVTVATRTKSKAESMIDNHRNGVAVAWTIEDQTTLEKMIVEHDITVSLLPYAHHVMVAKICIRNKKNMVTTSYVSPNMQALDQEAKDAGILILNELGLDPGIDHMSAMRIIDNVHGKGGKIEEFYSLCGAIPSPETAYQNLFGYKFSWSPKGVVMAGNNDGKYLKKGVETYVPTQDLFKNPMRFDFPEVGMLEIYPNRDSLPYINLYGIPETKTMFRGTFRHPHWCTITDNMKKLGLIGYDKIDLTGKSYADFLAMQIGASDSANINQKVAEYLGLDVDAIEIRAMEWLGLFSTAPMNRTEESPYEIISDLMIEKMMIGREERDMVVMQHIFLVSWSDGRREVVRSRMLDFGTQVTDTAIARTVALPAAIGVEMILEDKIHAKGVHIPVIPEVYNPILDALEYLDIRMIEEYGIPANEIFQ